MDQPLDRPVMILLTGGRSTPAVLGALALRSRALEFINSADQPAREDEIRSALASLPNQEPTQRGLDVVAYDIDATYQACAELIGRHGQGPFVINISCGTKVMAIGAYEYARREHIPVLYVDTGGKRVLDLTTHEAFPTPPMNVEGYLACFGRSPRWRFREKAMSVLLDVAANVARYLAEAGVPASDVLEQIRLNGGGKDRRTCRIKGYAPNAQEEAVWRHLVDVGLLDGAAAEGFHFGFVIKASADYEYLKGTWLEIYVWNQARRQMKKDNSSLFEDAQFNFEIPSDVTGAYKEIDVGLMYAGQLIHCSCKSGGKNIWSTQYLDELSAVSSLIGGRFCSRVFITSKLPPGKSDDEYDGYQRFLRQAKDREIVVIAGDQLRGIGALLMKEADKPTYSRI